MGIAISLFPDDISVVGKQLITASMQSLLMSKVSMLPYVIRNLLSYPDQFKNKQKCFTSLITTHRPFSQKHTTRFISVYATTMSPFIFTKIVKPCSAFNSVGAATKICSVVTFFGSKRWTSIDLHIPDQRHQKTSYLFLCLPFVSIHTLARHRNYYILSL